MIKEVEPSIPGRLRITREEKEMLYRFLRDEIGREGIRALAIIWFDEGKTEAEIAGDLLNCNKASFFISTEYSHFNPQETYYI